MRFYSTNDTSLRVNLKTAVLNSLPKDKGLYMPEAIEPLPQTFWKDFDQMSFPEMAFHISRQLLSESIEEEALRDIVNQAVNFDAPLHSLNDQLHVLELWHGPTLAFKDFGARFMAQVMSYLKRDSTDKLTILVATSGDTGGAVASGFFQTPHTQVYILYPKGRVSPLQEKQLTTLGANITALEVDGSFDDCQALVKQAFVDPQLTEAFQLTSANSINICRLIPQSFYYFRAYQQLKHRGEDVAMCIPSGNFGNLTAGLLAKRLGLPIDHFIAATNVNDVVPVYLEEGIFQARPSLPTLSNAMDVGNPSNFSRMMDLFKGNWKEITRYISGYRYTDAQTIDGIKEVFDNFGYTLDPHTAVAYLAGKEYQASHPATQLIMLGTAHPSKFPEAVAKASGVEVLIPERLARLEFLDKEAVDMSIDYQSFKQYLLGQLSA